MRISIARFAVGAALLGSHFGVSAEQCIGSVIASNRTVGLTGCISKEVAEVFVSVVNWQTDLVVVQSTGGDVKAALRIAKAIESKKLSMIVRNLCLSSCANYLMPAAASLSIERGSIIGFHGDAALTIRRTERANQIEGEAAQVVKEIVSEEAAFFASNARALLSHQLQSVALAEKEVMIEINRNGIATGCFGQGLVQWFPTLQLLQDLGLIDNITEHDQSLLPLIKRSVFRDTAATAAPHNISPLSSCVN